jgi:hypothetical protein
MQVPSDDSEWCCGDADCCSWVVQPSGQQMPSIAFNDANKTSITAASSLRTEVIILVANGDTDSRPHYDASAV